MGSDQRGMTINRVINHIWLYQHNPDQIGFQPDFQSLTVNLKFFEFFRDFGKILMNFESFFGNFEIFWDFSANFGKF